MWPFRWQTQPPEDTHQIRPRYEARPGVRPARPFNRPRRTIAAQRKVRRRRPATVGQTLWVTTALLVILALMLAGVGYFGFTDRVRGGGMFASQLTLQFAFAAMVVVVFAALGAILLRHFRGLRQLHRAMQMLANRDADWTPPSGQIEGGGAVAALFNGLSRMQEAWRGRSTLSGSRLTTLLGALSEGVVVVTHKGQVSLVNAGARALFGPKRLRVGSSAGEVFDADALGEAIGEAVRAGAPVRTELRTGAGELMELRIADLGADLGVMLSFSNIPETDAAGVEGDLALNDMPPEALPPDPETPLSELPGLALDTETTGMNVRDDRIVSMAAVRTFGARLYPAATFDELVNPGILIPPRVTAIHGIDDDAVADASPFPKVFQRMQPMAHATVLIGHNIAFDMAMLRHEAGRAALKWDAPYALCTMLLVAALEPERTEFSLEKVAADFGVDRLGHNTAMGDALLAAELFVKLIPALAAQGVATLGDALSFAEQPKALIQKQQAAGWR